MSLFLLGVLAYAAGSIPLHRFLGLTDHDAFAGTWQYIRSTLRFLLNIGKGLAVVEIGCLYDPDVALITAYCVILGHNYPVWTTFRGGIGLGVALGAQIALDPMVGQLALMTWLFGYYVFRNSVAAAVTSALATPAISSLFELSVSGIALLPLTAIILWRHRYAIIEAFVPPPAETEKA